ncbi:hypothetical protein [Streptomyces sp. N35]|uniref:hypothetical protein n=1 Tax=Streptomyces sp. N35 TaxID=2795730 RepID=UPI0018F514DE|nr:hypothetical protein [Streptomyces sp. N35]
MAKFEQEVDSVTVEVIAGGVVVSFASGLGDSEFDPGVRRRRVESASVFVVWGEARAICRALAQRESYSSPGIGADTPHGFHNVPWAGGTGESGCFQYFAGYTHFEVGLTERTQSELHSKLQAALEAAEESDETQLRLDDHRGFTLA